MHPIKLAVILFVFLNSINCLGQKVPAPIVMLKSQLALLEKQYWEVNLDSLAMETGKTIRSVLEKPSLKYNVDTLKGLTVKTSKTKSLKIYSFSYYTGGTKGDQSFSILYFKNSEGLVKTYELYREKPGFPGLPGSVQDIHPLNEGDLYLLMGVTRGSSIYVVSYAMVLQLKQNGALFNYPAFPGKSPVLFLYNYSGFNFEYKPDKKTIAIEGYVSERDQIGVQDGKNNIKPYDIDLFKEELKKEDGDRSLISVIYIFNGTAFVQKVQRLPQ